MDAGPPRPDRRRPWRPHPLIPILLLAAGLRLWGLAGQASFFYDAGTYLSEARFVAGAAQRAFGALLSPDSGPANPLERVVRAAEAGPPGEGHPPEMAKPGHTLLLAVAMLIVGQTPFAGLLVSAVAGTATVAATYALGALAWNRQVAVAAALLLAVSAQHLVYSREALVEADSLLFATLAALVYLRGVLRSPLLAAGPRADAGRSDPFRKVLRVLLAGDRGQPSSLARYGGVDGTVPKVRNGPLSAPALTPLARVRHSPWLLGGVGLLLAVAFLANNRLFYLPATLLAAEIALWRRDGGGVAHRLRQRALPLALGFLAPVVALQAALVALKALARTFGATADWPGYLEQLRAFSANNPPRPRLEQWPTFLVDATLMDGPLVVALALLGLAVALAPRRALAGRREHPAACQVTAVALATPGRALPDLLLASSILLPVGLFTVYTTGEVRMRFFSAGLPWMALAAGVGLQALGTWASRHRLPGQLASSALLALAVGLALPRAVELATPPNGYPALLRHLRASGIQRVASTNGPVLGVLLGEDRANARSRASFILDLEDYRSVVEQYRYVAVEMQAYLFPNPFTGAMDTQPPVFAVPHGNGAWFLADLLEHQGSAWGGWALVLDHWRTYADRATQLRLFDGQATPPP